MKGPILEHPAPASRSTQDSNVSKGGYLGDFGRLRVCAGEAAKKCLTKQSKSLNILEKRVYSMQISFAQRVGKSIAMVYELTD